MTPDARNHRPGRSRAVAAPTIPHPKETTVFALTIHQPWAGAIAHHGKHVENRVWPPSPAAVGQRLLIHAGAQRDRSVEADGPEFEVHRAVVAVATLAGAHLESGGCCAPWGESDAWHWELADVMPLLEPVPAKGARRLWRPAPEVVDAVAGQIGVAR